MTDPAWKAKPSYYLVAADDRMIPPPAQRMMAERAGSTVVETAGSHAVYVSKPEAVADTHRAGGRSESDSNQGGLIDPECHMAGRANGPPS